MGKLYPELDERLRKFIGKQSVFFVATAPCLPPLGDVIADDAGGNLSAGGHGNVGDGSAGADGSAGVHANAGGQGDAGGHVNVSPKGYQDTFAVLGPRMVAYLDLTGSGSETIAHLRQNGRITIMFCSFDRQAKVLRLYGSGRAVLPGDSEWDGLAEHFPVAVHGAAIRAIIVVELDRISDSCGYGVPLMEVQDERDTLIRYNETKTAQEHAAYRVEKNTVSIDGLPALDGFVTASSSSSASSDNGRDHAAGLSQPHGAPAR